MEAILKRFIGITCACFMFFSCMTVQPPVDRGIIDQSNTTESELITLNIDQYINIVSLDGKDIKWNKPNQSIREQFVKLNPGVHTFSVKYNDGNQFSIFPLTVVGNLEKSQNYLIKGNVKGNSLSVVIINAVTKEDVTLNMKKLNGDDSGILSTYIKYVLNPTMEESNKSIQLENDTSIIIYKPNMTYTKQDKKTGTIVSGYRGFIMDFTMKNGKVYLLETDISKMSKDEFLNKSEYENKAQEIMIPVKCSEKSVTYKYVKPDNKKDQEETFSISQM
jgi:hypothetical protein